jgi:hypothetical protein
MFLAMMDFNKLSEGIFRVQLSNLLPRKLVCDPLATCVEEERTQ